MVHLEGIEAIQLLGKFASRLLESCRRQPGVDWFRMALLSFAELNRPGSEEVSAYYIIHGRFFSSAVGREYGSKHRPWWKFNHKSIIVTIFSEELLLPIPMIVEDRSVAMVATAARVTLAWSHTRNGQ